VLGDPPIALASLRPDLPAPVVAAVMACLEKARERRTPDVAHFAEALAPYVPGGSGMVAGIREVLAASQLPSIGHTAVELTSSQASGLLPLFWPSSYGCACIPSRTPLRSRPRRLRPRSQVSSRPFRPCRPPLPELRRAPRPPQVSGPLLQRRPQRRASTPALCTASVPLCARRLRRRPRLPQARSTTAATANSVRGAPPRGLFSPRPPTPIGPSLLWDPFRCGPNA
jgi:hypothetical protein